MTAKRDYYEVLMVSREVDAPGLKQAYRKMAMIHHPDRNPDNPAAEEAFKEASEAYAVLSDAEKRRQYDRFGHAAFGAGAGGFGADFGAHVGSMGDMLEGLFGELLGRQTKRAQRGGRDVDYALDLDFVEAALGVEKEISVERPAPCGPCRGSGAAPGSTMSTCSSCAGKGSVKAKLGFLGINRVCNACDGAGKKADNACLGCDGSGSRLQTEQFTVHVPAGVKDGAVRTLRGGGEIATGGAGDLHVNIHVREHALFRREDADVLVMIPVSFPQAALGTDLEVPTLTGKVTMKLPAGTQSGKVLRLRGKGIPVYGGAGKGDQLVTIQVEVPATLSEKQRALIQKLAQEMHTGTEALNRVSHPERASFLSKLRTLFDG